MLLQIIFQDIAQNPNNDWVNAWPQEKLIQIHNGAARTYILQFVRYVLNSHPGCVN